MDEVKGMSFGEALKCLKAGSRVARRGWNGRGMRHTHMPAVTIPEALVNGRTKRFVPAGDLRCQAYFVMWTADGLWQPGWLASQADMCAEDWIPVPDAPDAPGSR